MLVKCRNIAYAMYVSAYHIVEQPESPSQGPIQESGPTEALRVLARIIARDLLTKRSAHNKKDDVKDDPQTFGDRS